MKSTRPNNGSRGLIQWSEGPVPCSCHYLGGDGGKTAAEVHVLVHLAAVGRQEPGPERLVLTSRPVAVALVRQELRQVPVVRRCGPDQRNEDGLRGHIELKRGNTISKLTNLERAGLAFMSVGATETRRFRNKGKKQKEAS